MTLWCVQWIPLHHVSGQLDAVDRNKRISIMDDAAIIEKLGSAVSNT